MPRSARIIYISHLAPCCLNMASLRQEDVESMRRKMKYSSVSFPGLLCPPKGSSFYSTCLFMYLSLSPPVFMSVCHLAVYWCCFVCFLTVAVCPSVFFYLFVLGGASVPYFYSHVCLLVSLCVSLPVCSFTDLRTSICLCILCVCLFVYKYSHLNITSTLKKKLDTVSFLMV